MDETKDTQALHIESKNLQTRRTMLMGATTVVGLGAAALGIWFGNRRLQSPIAQDELQSILSQTKLTTLEGQNTLLQSWFKERTMINFWATWCPPCVAEMPLINRIYQELASKNIQVIGVAVDKVEPVAQFVQEKRIQFPVLLAWAAGVGLSKHFGNKIGALPYSVLLDKAGRVVAKKTGEINEEELRLWVNGA